MGFYDADKVGEPDEEIELDLTNSHLASLEGVVVRQTLEVRNFGLCRARRFKPTKRCKSSTTRAVRGPDGESTQGCAGRPTAAEGCVQAGYCLSSACISRVLAAEITEHGKPAFGTPEERVLCSSVCTLLHCCRHPGSVEAHDLHPVVLVARSCS